MGRSLKPEEIDALSQEVRHRGEVPYYDCPELTQSLIDSQLSELFASGSIGLLEEEFFRSRPGYCYRIAFIGLEYF